MAVLVEAISIIVRRETIEEKYPGGVDRYAEDCPNGTFCMDKDIARVGFMSPEDVDVFIDNLELLGLTCVNDRKYDEIAVVVQFKGFILPCEWLEVLEVKLFEGNQKLTVCQIKDSAFSGIALPCGWNYETSLSKKVVMVESEGTDKRMKFLRHEDGVDYFQDALTGQELFIDRGIRRTTNGQMLH
jgi:hypothetical protein